MRMPFRGRHEISRRDAELLLDRAGGSAHPALADLLNAAAGPALPHETKGERAAVRRFRQAYGASLRASRRRPHRIGALLTATAAAVLLGGTAYAAGSGHLPDSLQRTAHDWFSGVGVPAPEHTSPSAPPSPGPSPSPSQSPSPSLSRVAPGVPPSPALVRDLCVAWQTFENDPRSRPLTAEERHLLGEAAGGNGKKQIDDFCAGVLGPAAPPSAKDPPDHPKPSKPGPGPKKSHE